MHLQLGGSQERKRTRPSIISATRSNQMMQSAQGVPATVELDCSITSAREKQNGGQQSPKRHFRIIEEMDVVSSINSLFQQLSVLQGKVREHERGIYDMKADMGTKLELEGVSNQKADKTFVQKM